MVTWVNSHGIAVLLGYYVFSAISGGMPTPSVTAGIAYQWAFRSLNLLNANIARLIATQLPTSSMGKALNGDNGK